MRLIDRLLGKGLQAEYQRIENDLEEKDKNIKFGSLSLTIFLLFIIYTFFFIGSSITTESTFFIVIQIIMRCIAILFGLLISYYGIRLIILQRRLNKQPIYIISTIIGMISITFYLFVSISSIMEYFFPT
ncbi:MAG: hypothetical protein KKH01_06970 [Firmicutes bacterium]|nr:hypothetical protein [Bacillota bacterium]